MARAQFRFYAELNCFLAPSLRGRRFVHECARDASVKHMVEALGVPHTEIECIIVNGSAVTFSYRLEEDDEVDVYPCRVLPHCPQPLRAPSPSRFIADAHLGALARKLRLLGFDVLYRNDYDDAHVAAIAVEEQRVVLTRDRDLLIRKAIAHGCFLHATDTEGQLSQVLQRFGLRSRIRAFTRCLNCNGVLQQVDKAAVADRVPPSSYARYSAFRECPACARVYWEGSHVERMRARIGRWLHEPDGDRLDASGTEAGALNPTSGSATPQ